MPTPRLSFRETHGVRRCSDFGMRRTLFAFLLAVLVLAAPAAGQDRPPLRASLAACETGRERVERFAVFTGSMPAVRGTQRMAMRFTLLWRREGGTRWRASKARAFRRWHRSAPGRGGFVWTKRVEGLRESAQYRAVVRFRWYAAGGRLQREVARATPLCRQPSQRPNLRVEAIEIAPATEPDTSRYRITVINDGLTPAGAFTLGLVVAEDERVREVAGLAAGERTTVEVVGRACEPGRVARVTLDVRGVVKESDERDNASDRACGGR